MEFLSGKRILITGCGGMLGSAVHPFFSAASGRVLATDKRKKTGQDWLEILDVRDAERVARTIGEFSPQIILHLAAETDLEYCQTHPDAAHETNARATGEIAGRADEAGCILVYVSTAGVFDGRKSGYYSEQDEPNPIMVYGQAKLEGEELVRRLCSRHYVVRAGWMVGGGPGNDHKFVAKILAQLEAGRKLVHAVDDKWGTPTYTHDFTRNLSRLLETERYGTYHMVCEGSATRFDVAREIVAISGHDQVEVEPVSSDYFEKEYFAPRPRSETLVNRNLEELGINLMRPWREALRDYIKRDYARAMANTKER